MLRVKGYFLLRSRKRVVQKIGEIDLAVASRKILAHLKQIASADHLVDRAASELCHILPQILCDKAHKILHIFRLAGKTLRSSGFCVAIPAGQVSRLQTRIITQPKVTSGAVANPNSSAPSSAAVATSRPLISLPSVSMRTLLRSPFIINV